MKIGTTLRWRLAMILVLASCSQVHENMRSPSLTNNMSGAEFRAMSATPIQIQGNRKSTIERASLWNAGPQSLLGDRRAILRGDILTVVIEIDDKAEISNSSSRSRSGSDSLGVSAFLGIPQRISDNVLGGASLDPAVSTTSSSDSVGDGSVRRNEKLTLRVAATIVDVLPNGILKIAGSQEVKVNFEIRELLVSGFARPEDISRQNEITYDKIASARISYGGRGVISDAQQPRYGQKFLDQVLPF